MIVKTLILTIVVMLLTFPVSSQDAMPTKEETLNYIHKKMQEVVGFRPFPNEEKWERMSFKVSGDNIHCEIAKEYPSHPELFVFNPRHIKGVTVGKPRGGNSIAWVGITF